MRVLVDTSVWVDFFNGYPSPQVETLAELLADEEEVAICGVVLAEVLQGLTRPTSFAEIRFSLLSLIYLRPSEPSSYLVAADLYRQLRAKGITIRSTIDCLIAVLAAENGFSLLFKDRDFEFIAASGLLAVNPVLTKF